MSRKALPALLFLVLLISGHSFAQKNEIGVVVGGTLSPDTDRISGVTCILNDPNCASANRTATKISYEGVFAHRIANLHIASFYLELPVVGIPNRSIRHISILPGTSNISQSFSSIFLTPGLKLKLSGPGISPFLSAGGGFAHFSPDNSSSSTTGAFQIGGGLDLSTPIPFVGLRGEVREFYTGNPFTTNLNTSRHNIFVGGGLVLHF